MTAPERSPKLIGACRTDPTTYTGERHMTATASLADIARRELADLGDRVVGPADPAYDEARAVHNGMIDKRPAVIVGCATADDVARCIALGRAHGAPIAVRGGGHNGGGLGVVDDGIVIDLAGMDEVVVDPEAHTVRVGGGATWGKSTSPPPSTGAPRRRGSSRPPVSVGLRSAAASAI